MGEDKLLKTTLRRLGVRAQSSRGQHFLSDPEIKQQILDFFAIEGRERVLEIGPGLGFLTAELFGQAGDFVCIELEQSFGDYLLKVIPGLVRERVLVGDVCKLDLSKLIGPKEQLFTVVGNLPYSISTQIVIWCLRNRLSIARACFLLQREFAERLAADPGGRAYGSLSVLRTIYADAELGGVIKGELFYPPAKVDSRLVRLNFLREPRIELSDLDQFERVVGGLFRARRKTLLNGLIAGGLVAERENAARLLGKVGVEPGRRAETLSLEEFLSICRALER